MEYTEVMEVMVKKNDPTYNYAKACEELSELNLVLLQYLTKKGTPKEPTRQAIVDELGDVIMRVGVLIEMMDCEDELEERIEFKVKQFSEYIKAGKFGGKI